MWVMLLFSCLQPSIGFTCTFWRQMPSSSHQTPALTQVRQVKMKNTSSSSSPFMSMTNNQSRAEFLHTCLINPLIALTPSAAHAFDGGVGGLGMQWNETIIFIHSDANNKTSSSSSCRFSGKTRPQTGVVFRDPTEAAETTTQTKLGNVNYELIAPDGSPVFLSFFAPWVSTYFHCSPWISSLCF